MKKLTILLLLLLLPLANAWQSEMAEVTENITQGLDTMESIRVIDNYIFETNTYKYLDYKKSLSKYWEDGIGDCTEMARIQYRMYKEIGLKSRIVHGCVMTPRVSRYTNKTYSYKCVKHDYTEFYYNNTWQTTEQDYFINTLVKKGRGIWK